MIEKLMIFFHDNWLGVILIMSLGIFLFWIMGYLANGLCGMHFDLASCWSGMGAIATAAAAGYGKWWADSKYNSISGEQPCRMGERNNERY